MGATATSTVRGMASVATSAPGDAVPWVSVIVPIRDEATRIERCLRAVLAQDWPADRLDVIVVDGGPGDGTGLVARRVLDDAPRVRSFVIDNPGGGRSANLNRGLAAARGGVVCRVDARSALPTDYVSTCVAALADASVAVVGGGQAAVAPRPGSRGAGISRGLNNRLSMGMARYRRNAASGPADTVYLGAFRRVALDEAGGWDEGLDVNEDFDLNTRIRRAGGTVWFDPSLRVDYLPRDTLRAISRQYWSFGRWKARYLRSRGERPMLRQAVGVLALPSTVVGAVVASASPRPVRRALAGAAILALALVDEVGSDSTGPVPLRTRAWGMATALAVVESWSAGAWAELLTGGRSRG